MVPSLWDLLDLVCKFLTYLGAASLAGTLFCLWLFKNKSGQLRDELLVYMAGGAFLGFQGALLRFFVQVGMVVDDGLVAAGASKGLLRLHEEAFELGPVA